MKQNITGSIIITAGVLILLANINFFELGHVLDQWWPLFFVLGALVIIINDVRNYLWALCLGGFGLILLLNNLNLTDIDVGDIIFPAIIIALGLSVLGRTKLPKTRKVDDSQEAINAILAGSSSKNTSNDYMGCSLTAVAGGIELDLSKATIKKSATIDMKVLMGGIELRVPEDVIVKSRASVFLGGIEDKTAPAKSKNQPTLYLEGSILMGGVEIKR